MFGLLFTGANAVFVNKRYVQKYGFGEGELSFLSTSDKRTVLVELKKRVEQHNSIKPLSHTSKSIRMR